MSGKSTKLTSVLGILSMSFFLTGALGPKPQKLPDLQKEAQQGKERRPKRRWGRSLERIHDPTRHRLGLGGTAVSRTQDLDRQSQNLSKDLETQ